MALSRRRLLVSTLGLGVAYGLGFATRDGLTWLKGRPVQSAAAAVRPPEGVRTGLSFGEAIARLVAEGAVVPGKLAGVYADRGGMPQWMVDALMGRDSGEIVLSNQTAPYLLNLFWPLGIANAVALYERNPLPARNLGGLASTGGWTLGIQPNGAAYYNRVAAVPLSEEQDAMVERMAAGIYRPCCDNSTLFPDCNHGAAMLGFLELAAASGMPEARIWGLAKVLNGYWYGSQYEAMALLFDLRDGTAWADVAPETALGETYSSISGWRANVDQPLKALRGPDGGPLQSGGSNCAV